MANHVPVCGGHVVCSIQPILPTVATVVTAPGSSAMLGNNQQTIGMNCINKVQSVSIGDKGGLSQNFPLEPNQGP